MKQKNMQNYLGTIINHQNGMNNLTVYLIKNMKYLKKIKIKKVKL